MKKYLTKESPGVELYNNGLDYKHTVDGEESRDETRKLDVGEQLNLLLELAYRFSEDDIRGLALSVSLDKAASVLCGVTELVAEFEELETE